jgi:HPt (histidine-containing phosphotransfer) domain-containing protein
MPESVYTEQSVSGNLYSLTSLAQFTYNDPESLKEILETFIESAKDNCMVLQEAAQINDINTVAQVAHKMIPMLRQMEVHSIVQKLLPLEDGSVILKADELKAYTDDVCNRVDTLCEKLETEMA